MKTPEAKLERIHRELRTDLEEGDLEGFVGLLQGKGEFFRNMLQGGLDEAGFRCLARVTFGLRRKGEDFLAPLASPCVLGRLEELVERLPQGGDPYAVLVEGTQDLDLDPKRLRALWNLAAEAAHFLDPQGVPLSTVWVTGDARSMGVLDYLFGRDPQRGVVDVPERHQRVREWLQSGGFYRDLPFVQDVYYAKGYVLYMVEMTEGLGLLDQQFGQGVHAVDYMAKLLGIDRTSSRHWLQ